MTARGGKIAKLMPKMDCRPGHCSAAVANWAGIAASSYARAMPRLYRFMGSRDKSWPEKLPSHCLWYPEESLIP